MSPGIIIGVVVIVAVVFAAASAFALVSARKSAERRRAVVKELEVEVPPVLEQMLSLFSYAHYVTESERAEAISQNRALKDKLQSVISSKELEHSPICKDATRLYKALAESERIKEENNSHFIERELRANSDFFEHVMKYPLNDQQRESIVSLEDNVLVIASAGSGKTMTSVGKVRYLIDRQGVDPSRILLITFTRKAAESLSERLGEKDLTCVTFHKLALNIIAKATGEKPTIAGSDFSAVVYHDLMDNDQSFKAAISDYILNSRYRMPDQFEYDSQEEYIKARMKYGVKSYYRDMDRRPVFCKSDEESRICDYLGRHGISFRYEAPYEVNTVDSEYRQYCPDFSIYFTDESGCQIRIYLEHFAVNGQGNCPSWFSEEDARKYKEGIIWKRGLHREHGTVLLETTSGDFHRGDVFTRLEKQLIDEGVPFNDNTQGELAREVARQEQSILGMLTSFNFLFKSKGCSEEEILSSASRNDLQTLRSIIFPYVRRYREMAREKGVIDFTDAIIRATALCNDGHRPEYDYILVDEFQDISLDRYKFLQALRRTSPLTKLFCVGDDWQSIYRFAGSDMALFKRFGRYFGYTRECRMETTYRFGEPAIGMTTKFILTNPEQKTKQVRPLSEDSRTEIRFEAYGVKSEAQTVREIIASIPEGKSVYLLGRYSFDVNSLNSDAFTVIQGRDGSTRIIVDGRETCFMTVHQSKGLESDYVILLNCNAGVTGFPSDIANSPVLKYVLSEPDGYEYGEERRLFYVALTRAKKCTYVMYDTGNPSPFVAEFVGEARKKHQDIPAEERCPKCRCGQRLLLRKGRAVNGNPYFVYGCSNEAFGCDYRETKFVNLNRKGRRSTKRH